MNWSPQQTRAIETVTAWYNDPDSPQIFRLFGYAGTGKTTLAKTLAAVLGVLTLFAAFTGKAAHVLRTKGCPAKTIHAIIYLPRDKSREALKALKAEAKGRAAGTLTQLPDPEVSDTGTAELDVHGNLVPVEWNAPQRPFGHLSDGELRIQTEKERENVSNPSYSLNPDSELAQAKLLVIDEVSMVGEQMARDLLSFGVKILVLGDPAQLPPVKSAGYFTEAEPDILLTEVHRQAEGDPIIDLATTVREGGKLYAGDGAGESRVISKASLLADPALAIDADIVLVGTHKQRRKFIDRLREERGRTSSYPEAGDKVMCLRNNKKLTIQNGQIFTVIEADAPDNGVVKMLVEDEDGRKVTVECHDAYFTMIEKEADKKYEDLGRWEFLEFEKFDFADAITVHKSQGSQWDNVLVYDESDVFSRNPGTPRRHLYTALTRASKKVTVVI